jgi:hypothetical protein
MPMSWRLAESLKTLRRQIDEAAPGRTKSSDGTIGDAAHASRSSDHNPWVKDGRTGVVTALDVTHDPRGGVDCEAIAAALRKSGDDRIKYIIWNRRIWNPDKAPDWRSYAGANPHTKHLHLSVRPERARYDDAREWDWGGAKASPTAAPADVRPMLIQGVAGQDIYVARAKEALIAALGKEAGFGPLMDGLLRGFQRQQGLGADGKIGAYTWEKLIG